VKGGGRTIREMREIMREEQGKVLREKGVAGEWSEVKQRGNKRASTNRRKGKDKVDVRIS